MRKRITSLLLTLAMLLSLLPAMGVTASAAEPEWTTVNTYKDLLDAVNDRKEYIKLGQNIDTTSYNEGIGLLKRDTLTFKYTGYHCTLDLNGKTLALMSRDANMFYGIDISLDAHLTIQDSSSAKTGKISGTFDNVLGGREAILIYATDSTLTLEGGTFTVASKPYKENAIVIDSERSFVTIKDGVKLSQPEFADEGYASDLDGIGYALKAETRKDSRGSVIIDGGEFDGCVKLTGSQATNGSVQINGGTFKKDVQVLYEAEENNSDPAVTVNGGTFEGNVYLQYWPWETRLYMPYRLNGGTFEGTVNLHAKTKKAVSGGGYFIYGDIGTEDQPESNPNIALGLDQCFGYSAVVTPNGTFTGPNVYTAVLKKIAKSEVYKMLLEGSASNPVRIIRNAWGMKSVTLDGKSINYAKDWKGTVENLTNDTAHTLKFEWNPLASELVNAGYSYRAECDRYISGNKTPTTDKNITGTEYSFTIPAGADPKVYSFALHLNLKKNDSDYNVGIYSNEHIVKLVVNEAPVAPPSLTGQVYYTSGIVYGRSISTGTGNLPTGFDSSKLRYQWQRSTDGGSKWTDIDGANDSRYTPKAADMGENVRIRVKITANGYLGEIVGAAVKVSKAANNNYPEVIKLEAVKNGAGNYTGFKITNFDSDYEYVYSTTDTPNWSANQIDSATVTGLTSDTTYYVFARFKETATQTAGSIVSKNSIKLFENVPLDRVLLEGYGSHGTIYIKKGESVTLKVNADPSNANYWSKITFKDEGATTSNIAISNGTINASTGTATPFPNGHTITITGVSTGSANLRASYPSATSSAYGTWYVVVYDDSTVANALRLESVYAYADITLSENDEAELPTDLPTLLPANSGYHLEWRILKRGTSGGYMHVTENANIKLENGKIKPKAAHAESEKTQLELVAVKDNDNTTIQLLPKKSLFYVTVTEAPTVELTDVTVAPTKVNLELNKTFQLSAVKEPVNAPGSLKWESNNTSVATVDSTGKVTAKAQGTAIITVSCGDKKATCTVTVAHTHDYTGQPWVYMDPGTHTQTCTAGDDTKYELHTWQWVVDTPATSTTAGSKHEKCTKCTATRNANTVIPATGGGSSSSGGSSGGGGVTTYAITVQNSKNGAVTASHKSAAKDTAVTLTVTPDKGYVLDTLNVLDSKNKAVKLTEKNGKYTFTMPAGKVTVSAAFKAAAPASENPFTDVPSGAYYEDAVIWAVKKGITSGTSATTFNPDGSCTRAQAVTFLWRAAGSPEPKSAAMPFTDVPAGSYFEKAVLWAVENGITKGTSDTTFSPDASCTRAQIVTFLWRAGGSPAVSGNSAFSDVASDAYYAAAVAWAEKNGVTGGIGGGLFGSDNTCTRAQIVTFLHRAMK